MGNIEHFLIGKRDLNTENHWTELDSESYRIKKPTVLCFGGNKTIKSKDANYLCKLAQNLVGIKTPKYQNEIATTNDIDFVGIAYRIDQTTGYGKNQKIADTSCLTEEEINELAINIFCPLYIGNEGKKTKDQILKNFSQITFLSHCHGALEVNALLHKIHYNMTAIGIDEQTVKDAFNQFYSVSYAPREIVRCPGLQIIPEKDYTNFGGPALSPISSDFLSHRFSNKQSGNGTVAFKENNNTISLIVSHITNSDQDEHPISYVQRDENWQMLEEDIAYGNEVSIAMGVALSYSIANGIQNQNSSQFIPKPTTDMLLTEIQSVLGKTQNSKFIEDVERIKANLTSNHHENQIER